MPLALMRICALRCARGKQQRLAAVALRQPVVARTFASPASPIPAPVTDVASTSVSGDATRGARSWMEPVNLHPRAVVEALSRHIIGQDDAKRAIAIALRNRWRRTRLPQEMQVGDVDTDVYRGGASPTRSLWLRMPSHQLSCSAQHTRVHPGRDHPEEYFDGRPYWLW